MFNLKRILTILVLIVVMLLGIGHAMKQFSGKVALSKGCELINKGDYDAAIVAFTETIRTFPRAVIVCYDRGEAIRITPTAAVAYYDRGVAYLAKGDTAKAEADFEQAKKLGYKS